MRKYLKIAIVASVALFSSVAMADIVVNDANSVQRTVLNFICQTTKLCQANVIIDSTGTEKATAGNPLRTDPTGTTTQPINVASVGGSAVTTDPCYINAQSRALVNIVTAANTKVIVGTASKKTYVCAVTLYPGGTTNFALVEGSGTNCATSPLALIGGNTAATGILATQGNGFVSNGGGFTVMNSTVNANDVCIITSAAVQLSGVISYVQQ